MTRSDPEAAFFEYPECVVIDIACEHYHDVGDERARVAIARLQAAALRELVAGRVRQAAALRLELIAACAARGIAVERIGSVDLAILHELTRIASARFRTSLRLKAEACGRLDAALTQLRPRQAPPPVRRPAPVTSRKAAAVIG